MGDWYENERYNSHIVIPAKAGIQKGGELNKYYPFNEEGRREYEERLAAQK